MSTRAPLSCGAKSLNRPVGSQYRLQDCTCKFQPKPSGTFTPLGFSFSSCQAPGKGLSSCCNRPSACIETKRRRGQGFTNYFQQPIMNSAHTVTQGKAIGKSGAAAVVAALDALCDGMDNVSDPSTLSLLQSLVDGN